MKLKLIQGLQIIFKFIKSQKKVYLVILLIFLDYIGSEISGPTLDNLIDDFIEYRFVDKDENNYLMLNRESDIVKSFARANILLTMKEAKI